MDLFTPRVKPPSLRWYQDDAKASIERWESNRQLIVMATGTGKTVTFGSVARDFHGRVLVLAHRDELIRQAVGALSAVCTYEAIGVEKADEKSCRERVVVGSIQTCCRPKRLEKLIRAGGFGLIVIDEAHHAVAATYRRTIEALAEAGDVKVLGVTATPKRADKRALGMQFDSVAYEFDIATATREGYLVPVQGVEATIERLDLSTVKITAGEFSIAELEAAMIEAVEGIVQVTVAEWKDRCGPVFLPGKRSAVYAAERFNAVKPGSAVVVTDDTPPEERKAIMDSVKQGNVQYLCNCMVATEGFDWPEASLMVGGRPTKSAALMTQMVGRVTRTLPGIVDAHPGRDQAEERRAAIAASAKPNCLVANFVGAKGRAVQATVHDVLGGKYYSEEEIARAKEIASIKGSTPTTANEALEAARRELAEAAAKIASSASWATEAYNPFEFVAEEARAAIADGAGRGVPQRHPISPKQADYLAALGVSRSAVMGMGKQRASILIETLIRRRQQGLSTVEQIRKLAMFGIEAKAWTSKRAKEALATIDKRKGILGPEDLRKLKAG